MTAAMALAGLHATTVGASCRLRGPRDAARATRPGVSVRVMAVVWGWALPVAEKLVALKLADCADDRGCNAWPAVATIAADCGLSRRGTQKVLERLRERGCIEVQAASTNRKSTTYRVAMVADVPGGSGQQRECDGGERGAPLEANDVHPCDSVGANGTTRRGERDSPLEANVVRPIRPTTVMDPSEKSTRETRARVFAGSRLKVSQAQHQLVLDELGSAARRIDLREKYREWDRQLQASGETFDTLEFIRRKVAECVRTLRALGPVYATDFANWCQHERPCHSRHYHEALLQRERDVVMRA